jgi:hypothetical protein
MQAAKLPHLLIVVVLGLFSTSQLMAQKESAALSGLVLDASDLPVPNASVTAKELETGFKWQAETNSSGYYAFPYLKPGQYEIRVNKESFKPVTSTFHAQVNQAIRLDFRLDLGPISEQVNVTATEDLLQVENTAIGGHVEGSRDRKSVV